MADPSPRVIALCLMDPEEMFILGQTDLFSEYRNFLTGIEYAISVLRGHRSRRPVRLEVSLPPDQIDERTGDRIARTLRRYAEDRIAYNQRERRATRFDGLESLWVGVPIALVGFLIVVVTSRVAGRSQNPNVVFDSAGWVLVWVGLWFPLDTLFFSPLAYGREIRALERLRTAEVAVMATQLPPAS